MAHPVRTAEPSLASKYSSRSSSRSLSRPPGRVSNADLLDRIHAAENRSQGHRSHAGSLVHHKHEHRSVEEINAEIAALEAEAQAEQWRRKADAEREREHWIHDHQRNRSQRRSERFEDYEVVEEEEKRRVYRRPAREEFYERERDDEIVLFDGGRSRSLPTVGREEYIVPYRPRDEYVVYERRRSPVRNVVRVQKDRKGRMALVKSSR